jgi:benzodiazapine receptor
MSSMSWYDALRKSAWNPPPIVFRIVWPVLYSLMAISAWTWWIQHPQSFSALPYLTPLFFNALWVWVFFVRHELSLSVVVLALNLLVATVSVYRIYTHCPSAARWLIPNLVWLMFALYLNSVVWWRNR